MGKRVLLVEGKNDWHVIVQLCKYHQIPDFEIKENQGIDNLVIQFPCFFVIDRVAPISRKP